MNIKTKLASLAFAGLFIAGTSMASSNSPRVAIQDLKVVGETGSMVAFAPMSHHGHHGHHGHHHGHHGYHGYYHGYYHGGYHGYFHGYHSYFHGTSKKAPNGEIPSPQHNG